MCVRSLSLVNSMKTKEHVFLKLIRNNTQGIKIQHNSKNNRNINTMAEVNLAFLLIHKI